eukprot:gnl/TRDRNA2_/TRDRNA2_185333_c0_seq1.p1 gnl/TRDRNA2_/TRDRNA2_185333_c0~~gnl/TRDRNA2_/TRDRNA2_185333_c0_seq1.p1  ORF type:complete len:208 (+),score=36.35 gnl/TRDRNA2_/TRDRNA2_185333_c0_seq1:84-707(+)
MASRFIILASLVVGALGGSHVSPKGNPGCACLGEIPDCIPRVKCDKPFADANGECVQPTVQEKLQMYPTNYGTLCVTHIEPGHTACYDVEAGVEKPAFGSGSADEKAKWCDDPWCYIDPCNCNAPERYAADYFASYSCLWYTYLTCGDSDAYSGEADGSAAVEAGNEMTCPFYKDKATGASEQETSGSESIKPLLSTLFVLLAAARW